MTEKLLHFIWQHRYFAEAGLQTTEGDPLTILSPGVLNAHQGPDFSNAKIRINDTVWAGSVELHLRSSEWNRHGHTADPNYRNVVLHVVWKDDWPPGTPKPAIPVLELEGRVPRQLWPRYQALMDSAAFIPCASMIGQVPELVWTSWKERLVAERLGRKSIGIFSRLEESRQHWEEVFWWLLARNFGMRVNADAFESVARSVSLSILARHKHQLIQLEALLLGQAGLLEEEMTEDYPRLLKQEYRFLQAKYNLAPIALPVHFLRMRPGNFPTVRLAQLASLIHHSSHLFSRIKEAQDLQTLLKLLEVTANDYWHYHYHFGQESAFRHKRLGQNMQRNILINTVIPVLFAYGLYQNDQGMKDKAIRWLQGLAPESNSIMTGFMELGILHCDAFDSQALTELRNEYCTPKRCLDCAVGNALLKRPGAE